MSLLNTAVYPPYYGEADLSHPLSSAAQLCAHLNALPPNNDLVCSAAKVAFCNISTPVGYHCSRGLSTRSTGHPTPATSQRQAMHASTRLQYLQGAASSTQLIGPSPFRASQTRPMTPMHDFAPTHLCLTPWSSTISTSPTSPAPNWRTRQKWPSSRCPSRSATVWSACRLRSWSWPLLSTLECKSRVE